MSLHALDFAPITPSVRLQRVSRFTILLAIVFCCCFGVFSVRLIHALEVRNTKMQLIEEQRQQLAQLNRKNETLKHNSTNTGMTPQQTVLLNQAVARLNIPWTNLFESIQAASVDDVGILKLEPDVMAGHITVSAEARNTDAMVKFVETLGRQESFHDVYLQKHETQELDPNKPIRFQINVGWSKR